MDVHQPGYWADHDRPDLEEGSMGPGGAATGGEDPTHADEWGDEAVEVLHETKPSNRNDPTGDATRPSGT